MPEPNFIIDTAPEVEAVLIRLLRAKPPARRLEEAVAASNRVAEQCKQAIRRMNPELSEACLLYTSPSPRDRTRSRMPSSA